MRHKSLISRIIILFLYTSFLLPFIPVPVTHAFYTPNYFYDNFNANNMDKWTIYGGTWSASTGVATVNAGPGYKAIATNEILGDLDFMTDVQFDSLAGNAGVIFRVSNPAVGADSYTGYYAGLDSAGSVILGKANNNWTFLASTAFTVTANTTYRMRIVALGSSIKVYVNDMNTPKINVTDTSYTSGLIGLRTYNAPARFDYITASEFNVPTAPVEKVKNRSPLLQTPFYPLPLGSVKAEGWLLNQLQLLRDGATGYAEEIHSTVLGKESIWLGGPGVLTNGAKAPDEGVQYYLKGLVALAYTLNDANLIAKAQKYINWALESQNPDGSFGPKDFTVVDPPTYDYWPRMPFLYALKDYYEATGDSRVIPFMTKYFEWQRNTLSTIPLSQTGWGQARAGDNIETVLWLYNQTGEEALLTLADTLYAQAYDLTSIYTNNTFTDYRTFPNGDFDFMSQHGVNVAQDIKMPTIYYQRSKNPADRDAFMAGNIHLLRDNASITGVSPATEMLAGINSIAGQELCAIVERMQSNETAQMILGDSRIGDQLERIAFNALPGAMDKQNKIHQYYSAPNQVQSKSGDHAIRANFPNAFMPGPYSGFACCRFDLHMGWAYYVKNMWAATSDNGLAAMAYGPSHVTTKVGSSDVSVSLTESTNYPFSDEITFTLNTGTSVAFPLELRIPEWTKGATVLVNGVAQTGVTSGEFYTINRTWNNNDVVTLTLPMKVTTSTGINNSVGVERGPLVYSLKMDEVWTSVGRTNDPWDLTPSPVAGFNQYEVTPNNAWNYGLIINRDNPENFVTVTTSSMPTNPFIQSTTPVKLTVNAKKIPSWGINGGGIHAQEPPAGPIYSSEATESVTLVPYGAQNIRVTYFPVISKDSTESGPVKYEAEAATINDAGILSNNIYASGNKLVGGINNTGSYVEFGNVNAPAAGSYDVTVRYANGMGDSYSGWFSTHNLSVNAGGTDPQTYSLRYEPTQGWGKFGNVVKRVRLNAGNNVLRFAKGSDFAEIDYISIAPVKQLYKITNKNSGKVLEVANASTSKGANVQQQADNGITAGGQQWFLEPTVNGYFKIRNNNSDHLLEVGSDSTSAGANVDQWQDIGRKTEEWKFISTGDGYYKLQNRNSGLVLNVASSSTANGANIEQNTDTGVDAQKWLIEPIGNVKLISSSSGLAVEVANSSTLEGANISQYDDNSLPSQDWKFVSLNNGYFKIENRNSSKVMGLSNGDANGSNIVQTAYTGTTSQAWRLIINNDGSFQFMPQISTTRVADIYAGSLVNGGNINLWAITGGTNQHWFFKPSKY
jgi:hypothetical protein